MVDPIPADLADKMMDALASHDKARALLLYFRASDADLETSWQVVQQMIRDLGEVGELPATPSRDWSFREVKDYLTTDRAARWRRFLGTLALATLFFVFPGYVLLGKSARLKTSLQSLFWSPTQATIINQRTYFKRNYEDGREVDRHYQDFLYRYEVDGEEHTGIRHMLSYYPALGDKPLKSGDPIRVFYNPSKPSQSLYKREIYKLTATLLFNLGLVTFGVLVAWFGWRRERHWRQLHRMDEQLSESKPWAG